MLGFGDCAETTQTGRLDDFFAYREAEERLLSRIPVPLANTEALLFKHMVATALPLSDVNPTTCAPRPILLHRSRLLGATLQAMWAVRTTIVPRLTDELICREVMLLDILYLFFRFLSSRNFATTTAFCLLHETSGIHIDCKKIKIESRTSPTHSHNTEE